MLLGVEGASVRRRAGDDAKSAGALSQCASSANHSLKALDPKWPIREVDVGERLPVGVADDEAGVGFLGGPRRREFGATSSPNSKEHAHQHENPGKQPCDRKAALVDHDGLAIDEAVKCRKQ